MPRFTDDELRRLADKHEAETRPGFSPFADPAQELRLVDTVRERAILTRFAEIPAYDDAEGRRAALPTYTDLPGMDRFERSARVEYARKTRMWVVSTQETPTPDHDEPPQIHGRFRSLSEAMEVARAEARYVVRRPARTAPATTARVAELRAAAFTDPTDVQEVCS